MDQEPYPSILSHLGPPAIRRVKRNGEMSMDDDIVHRW